MSKDEVPRVCDENKELLGMPYEDWTIKFWQWLISIPADRNPALDKTGENCAVAQFGQPVFNLVFSNLSSGVDRRCTLRAGQHILIPLNVVEVSFAEYPSAKTEEDLHRIARWEFDASCKPERSLSVTVNHNQQPHLLSTQDNPLGFRVHSRSFDVKFPENPIFGLPGPSRAVSDGYWAILEPLPQGEHDIHFGASLVNPTTGKLFYKDSVRYTIEVLP